MGLTDTPKQRNTLGLYLPPEVLSDLARVQDTTVDDQPPDDHADPEHEGERLTEAYRMREEVEA